MKLSSLPFLLLVVAAVLAAPSFAQPLPVPRTDNAGDLAAPEAAGRTLIGGVEPVEPRISIGYRAIPGTSAASVP